MVKETSYFYIYHFDKIKNQYRKIIRFDIKNQDDNIYFIDESISENSAQLSFHESGQVHIKHYGGKFFKSKKYIKLFKNPDLFKEDRCHQFMYYKLGDISCYPLVASNKIFQPNLILKDGDEKTNGKVMIKFLVGKLSLKSNLIHKQHIPFGAYGFGNKLIICSPLIVEAESENDKDIIEHNNGALILLFNSNKEIPDTELFNKKIDIGKSKTRKRNEFQIDWKEEDINGKKIISIFYRINKKTFQHILKCKLKYFLDTVKLLFRF